jgi:hypothetical protein
MIVPELIEPIIGYRAWLYTEAGLRSLVKPDVWPVRQRMEATCVHGHDVPDAGCTCGIWALRNPYDPLLVLRETFSRWPLHPVVIGSVKLWGLVGSGPRGFRAQYAYPGELCLVGGRQTFDLPSAQQRRLAWEIGSLYGTTCMAGGEPPEDEVAA